MTAGSRKSRNYKEKGVMMAFGQMVLPIAALVAVGLLFVGVKLFFLTPPNRAGVEVIAGTVTDAEALQVAEPVSQDLAVGSPGKAVSAEVAAKPGESKPQQPKQSVVLAGPVDPTRPGRQANSGTRPAAAKPAASAGAARDARPAQTAARPGSRWGVQIGAFTREEGANTISAQAKKDGYTTTISTVDSSGTKFFRVRISAGDTKEKAENLAAELEKKGYPIAVLPMQ